MRHLTEEQLVGLVLEHRAGCQGRNGEREHLGVCPECRAKYAELHQVTAFLGESRALPPVSAWTRLKRRMERSCRPGHDWTEPRWLPLVCLHLATVIAALGLIVVLGGWVESSALWEWIVTFRLISSIGPYGLVALVFIVGGGLCVLALTPVLWWESRTRG